MFWKQYIYIQYVGSREGRANMLVVMLSAERRTMLNRRV